MQAVVGPMRDGGGGSIVNVSSIAGLQGVAGAVPYVASKWAIRGMTKAAAIEFGPANIRVNVVHPGVIDTLMVNNPQFDDVDPGAACAGFPIPADGSPRRGGRARGLPGLRCVVVLHGSGVPRRGRGPGRSPGRDPRAMTIDLLLTGGLVVDGTGVPGRLADVAITDGVVAGIGRLAGTEAARS